MSDYAPSKNKNPKIICSTSMVMDHTPIKKPFILVNATKQPRRMFRGSYQADNPLEDEAKINKLYQLHLPN